MAESIFTKIIRGDLPSYRVWEDEGFFAFLDIHPIQRGHTLLIPKKEVDSIWDLDEQTYATLFQRVRFLAGPIGRAVSAVRTGVAVEGLAVPHVHVHLIPINQTADINPTKHYASTKEDFEAVAEAIRQEIARG